MTTRTITALVAALAVAGCSSSGGSNASNQTASAAPAEASAAPAQAGGAVSSSIPVYPGAEKYALGDMSMTKCGHKNTVESYTVSGDLKTITDWYAGKMPGSINIDLGKAFGHGLMESTEFIASDGSAAVAVTQAHLPSGASLPGLKGNPVIIGIGTYDPPFSATELADVQNLGSNDPATRDAEMAKIKAKCGTRGI